LEEALHPQIGNGAGWQSPVHDEQLRLTDPSKLIESKLLNNEEAAGITNQWRDELEGKEVANMQGEVTLSRETLREVEEAEWFDSAHQQKAEEAELAKGTERAAAVKKAEVAQEPAKGGSQQRAKGAIKARPKKEEKVKAGKRVRKLAEKEEEKTIESNRKIREQFTGGPEEQLTPFTSWLKSLKGSEYVHPYEDDFAFLQTEGPVREGISETYADLLAAQGYREQAIDMYRRLMEKFPEKNRFFAAKIDALQ
jgi:hypothetical protein